MEERFLICEDGVKVPCVLTVPEDGDIQRVVLGVHGLGGGSNDAIQAGLAEEMALFYSAMLRFDFPAHGESPMENDGFTLKNCLSCLLAVAKEAKKRFPEVEDLCIFASGFGAYVTLIALDDLLALPGQVKLVVQTPSVMMHETLLAMKGITRETLWAMDRVTFRSPRPFDVTYSFYEELQENPALVSYPIPMLILMGEEDAFIKISDVMTLRRLNDQAKLVVIPGASHRFLEDGAWDMVLDLTRDWFEFEQVLCCDWE